MELNPEESIVLSRKGIFWVKYIISVCMLIINIGLNFVFCTFLIDTWTTMENPYSDPSWILLILFPIAFIQIKDLKNKPPYHAFDQIKISAFGIDFYNCQTHQIVKNFKLTDILQYKIDAHCSDDYAHFYIDIILYSWRKERINLSSYMKPSEYPKYENQISQIFHIHCRNLLHA